MRAVRSSASVQIRSRQDVPDNEDELERAFQVSPKAIFAALCEVELAIACQQDHPDSRLNNVDDLATDPPSACILCSCPDICPSHEAIKQRKQNTLKDVDADQIDIYLQEARSPRLSFLLDPSHAAYDIGRLERGNPSKAHRPPCVRTPASPTLGSVMAI